MVGDKLNSLMYANDPAIIGMPWSVRWGVGEPKRKTPSGKMDQG